MAVKAPYVPGASIQAQGRIIRKRFSTAALKKKKDADARNSKLRHQLFDGIKALEEWTFDTNRPVFLMLPIVIGVVLVFLAIVGAILGAIGWLVYVLFVPQPEATIRLDAAEWTCSAPRGDTCDQWTKR